MIKFIKQTSKHPNKQKDKPTPPQQRQTTSNKQTKQHKRNSISRQKKVIITK
jgi:hypothetical protein